MEVMATAAAAMATVVVVMGKAVEATATVAKDMAEEAMVAVAVAWPVVGSHNVQCNWPCNAPNWQANCTVRSCRHCVARTSPNNHSL